MSVTWNVQDGTGIHKVTVKIGERCKALHVIAIDFEPIRRAHPRAVRDVRVSCSTMFFFRL